jgi:predicted RNase H-like HicB family nuclease
MKWTSSNPLTAIGRSSACRMRLVHLLITRGACSYLQRSPSPLAGGVPSLVPREPRRVKYKFPQLIVHGMKLRVVLEPSEEGGYTVYVPSLPGCISEGDTREEALENIREAIDLYLEAVEDDLVFSQLPPPNGGGLPPGPLAGHRVAL